MKNLSLFAFRAMRVGSARGQASAAASAADFRAGRALGSWQAHAMDWAIEPSGRVSLIEVNAAPGMRGYSSMPSLAPGVWTTMFELVALAQRASPEWLQHKAKSGEFTYWGWHLIYNELGAEEQAQRYSCASARVMAGRWE